MKARWNWKRFFDDINWKEKGRRCFPPYRSIFWGTKSWVTLEDGVGEKTVRQRRRCCVRLLRTSWLSPRFLSLSWRQIWSNNPQERLNREIRRRSDVGGIFPNREAIIRLIGAVFGEYNDECMVTRRYMSVGTLQKAQDPAHSGSDKEHEELQQEPVLVEQLAA